ncbi:MFS transporter [Nakamurella sp. YIM 132087]|uniref:Putative proline/betaine transporter n=1 Tax=Nakamurella alba TaxID=2665158 RepID=A0A7K1FNE4_9ACTN|nr:MFS transporter [Nakamurella alba]MTD14829.1 MFS transporter [Nakamurella alba]
MSTHLPSRSEQRRIAFACIIGNFLEYFEFALYGFFAVAIGATFFPSDDPSTELLQSLAVFGVAFLLRPVGGVVFGLIGDRIGRRASLSISITMMSLATAAIGLLPGYDTLGVWAPILLVLIRCIQGLSVGGEWGASSAFLIETAGPGLRGQRGSYPSMAAAIGFVGGSLLSLGFGLAFTAEQLNSWGWRIPFLVALPLGLLGLYIRRKLEDTPVFRQIEQQDDRPKARLRDAIDLRNWRPLLVTFGFSWICGVGLYYLTSYVVNYLTATVKLPRTEAALLVAIGLGIYAVLCPIAGRLSDRFGRRRTIIFGCIGHVVLAVPVFLLLGSGNAVLIVLALIVYAIMQAPINANTSLIMIEIFPAGTRLTNGSLAFNLGVGPPSGFGPLVAAALVAGTGLTFSPGFFLAGVALFSLVVLYFLMPETAGRDLTLEHDAVQDQRRPARLDKTRETARG